MSKALSAAIDKRSPFFLVAPPFPLIAPKWIISILQSQRTAVERVTIRHKVTNNHQCIYTFTEKVILSKLSLS